MNLSQAHSSLFVQSNAIALVDEAAARAYDCKHSIWKSAVSTFADPAALHDANDTWLRVEGVFQRGPGGHRGLWPGEIVRLTRIEQISPPQ